MNESAEDPRRAWARYEPGADRPWDLVRVAHLLRRAGFGATWDDLRRARDADPHRTIDRLLRPQADVDADDRKRDADERTAAGSSDANSLRAWWLRRMLETPHPLREKMTLLWHDHFGVGNERVESAYLICDHVRHLRHHALGSLRALIEGIARDPAVLLSIDAVSSRRMQPDENFPRWLFDQCLLGPGVATDADVREAARAFTGRFVLRGELRFFAGEHDAGRKRILGREGEFGAEDVIRIALDHPAAARHIARTLYRWFITETEDPPDSLVEPLVEAFGPQLDIAGPVERILRSNHFFSPAAYRRRIKSPVEFALGIIGGFGAIVSTTQLAADLAGLGQNLLHPPTVKGWTGGKWWIDAATLAARSNLAHALLSGAKPYGKAIDPLAAAERYGHTTPAAAGR
ncbi:MAG: DUF1800 family protein, partial [Planctomycetes bacterium]|nr:DUF1800 family protein [Planctomycetota bacterium]